MAGRKQISTADRFEEKYVVQQDGCWYWTAHLDDKGYGRFKLDYKPMRAHRVSWFLRHHYWPTELDHLCRVRRCVNPDHLEEVDRSTNLKRGLKGELGRPPGRCRSGKHHWIEGQQRCRPCQVTRPETK